MKTLLGNVQPIPLLNSADYGAGVDFDSINMEGLHSVLLILTFGAVTGNAVLTINSGATAGTKTTALTVGGYVGGAAVGSASADVLTAITAAASHTMTGATYQNKMVVFEVPAAKLAANGHSWLTASLSSAATSGILHAVAIGIPRYKQAAIPTAL